MKKIAQALTKYVIYSGMVKESDRSIYEYGFIVALEVGLFVIFSILIAMCLDMPVEGLLFFVIFAPLRSYAGGLHLEKFFACFLLSCLTYSAVLLTVKNIQMPIESSFIIFLMFEAAVYVLYPVEHVNRKVDEDEDKYFKKKLLKYLFIDLFIGITCFLFKMSQILFEAAIIFFIIVITMILGKCKGKYLSSKS